MLRFKLTAPTARKVAAEVLRRAKGGEVVEVSNLEVIEALVGMLDWIENEGAEAMFFREEGSRRVTYDLNEMRVCLRENIGCRPAEED